MRVGIREICDVTFKPLTSVDIGNQHFDAYQPVLYLDTAKTSSLEGAATTVYAQGGKGNPRLIGWDGEKTLTLTVEDALISPVSFSMLSGAGIVKGVGDADNDTDDKKVYTHETFDLVIEKDAAGNFWAVLEQDVRDGAIIVASKEAPIYAVTLDSAGAQKAFLSSISPVRGEVQVLVDGEWKDISAYIGPRGAFKVAADADIRFKLAPTYAGNNQYDNADLYDELVSGEAVRIDCYTVHGAGAQELEIAADEFAGYYYIEASTLFREEATGRDLPAQFVIPRGKIQSNFTFSMANSGDPSEQLMRMAA